MEGISGISASVNSYQRMDQTQARDVQKQEESETTKKTDINVENTVKETQKGDNSVSAKDETTTVVADPDKALSIIKEQLRQTKLQISYNDEVNRFSIAILDDKTDKVIKEIPSEDALKLLQNNMELAGLLVDERR